jgi:predicted nucleic acid-binding protein
MQNILIDTDVLLDYFFDREPFSLNSEEIIHLCEENIIQGFITPVICSNLYYLLRKISNHKKVIDNLKMLLSVIDILNIDKNVVLKALYSDFSDFEDALQNYSALNNGKITTILTRNIKDYKSSSLQIMTPDEFLANHT